MTRILRSLYRWLRTPQVHVKPTTNKTEVFGWQAISLKPLQSFGDDCRRYGLFTALYNLRVLWERRHETD